MRVSDATRTEKTPDSLRTEVPDNAETFGTLRKVSLQLKEHHQFTEKKAAKKKTFHFSPPSPRRPRNPWEIPGKFG